MPVPVARTPRTSGPVHATRQQLDELEALLQRMLSLPVSPAEEVEPGPVPQAIVAPEEETPAPPWDRRLATHPSPPVAPTPAAAGHLPRSYPASYMVVETTLSMLDGAALPPPADADLGPKRVSGGGHEANPLRGQVPPLDHPADGEPFVGASGQPEEVWEREANGQAEAEGGDWVPLRSSWQPSAQTWKPLAETWEQSRVSPAPAVPEPPVITPPPRPPVEVPVWGEEVIPPPPPGYEAVHAAAPPLPPAAPVAAPEGPLMSPLPAPPPPPAARPAVLAPLAWFNQGFDWALTPLGAPGRWLCGPAGRGFLGTTGVLCLAAAALLAVADGFGWTR